MNGMSRTEQDLLAEHHQFLRDADDESDNSYGARVARKYYDSLYKEVREARTLVDIARSLLRRL